MRLDKYLSDCGLGTRSQVKEIIRKKNVTVNNEIVTDSGFSLKDSDLVCMRGEIIKKKGNSYFMFYKPAGCVSATTDSQKTVIDYFKAENNSHLFPVGRLDKDTEGLLFITDDGAFAHNITSPRKHIPKTYYFEGDGIIVENASDIALNGMTLDSELLKPAKLTFTVDQTDKTTKGHITISEGKYHQVKRMLKQLGVVITYLKRESIGDIQLDSTLLKGQYRPLTKEELQKFC